MNNKMCKGRFLAGFAGCVRSCHRLGRKLISALHDNDWLIFNNRPVLATYVGKVIHQSSPNGRDRLGNILALAPGLSLGRFGWHWNSDYIYPYSVMASPSENMTKAAGALTELQAGWWLWAPPLGGLQLLALSPLASQWYVHCIHF